ncbi:MAG: hypothetical protein RXR06_11325 [Thermoproteus sp.]
MRMAVPDTKKGSPNRGFYVEFDVKEGRVGGNYREVYAYTEFSALLHLYCRAEAGGDGTLKIEDAAQKPNGGSSSSRIIELAKRGSRSSEMLRSPSHVLFVESSYLYSFGIEYYFEAKQRSFIVYGVQPLLVV